MAALRGVDYVVIFPEPTVDAAARAAAARRPLQGHRLHRRHRARARHRPRLRRPHRHRRRSRRITRPATCWRASADEHPDRPARRARRHRPRACRRRPRCARRCPTRGSTGWSTRKHRAVLDLVTGVDRVVTLERPLGRRPGSTSSARLRQALRRGVRFAGADEVRGAGARVGRGARRSGSRSGTCARRRRGRSIPRPTTAAAERAGARHVIHKNLHLLSVLGVETERGRVSAGATCSSDARAVGRRTARPFALINPGAAWPNKRWPPERFGEVAAFLRDVRGLRSSCSGARARSGWRARSSTPRGARRARRRRPHCRISLALSRAASLMVSGDTGPLHIAAAVGTPVVGLFGPTDPERNGRGRRTTSSSRGMASCRVPLPAAVSRSDLVPWRRRRGGSDGGDSQQRLGAAAGRVAAPRSTGRAGVRMSEVARRARALSRAARFPVRRAGAVAGAADARAAWPPARRSRASASCCGSGPQGTSRRAAR